MIKSKSKIAYVEFFDQIFAEIERGNVPLGINMLAGMLDAIAQYPSLLLRAQQTLRHHILHQLLLEDPIYRHATLHVNNYPGLISAISGNSHPLTISPTGRKVLAATSDLPIVRALREREIAGARKLRAAWKAGARMCLLGTAGLHDHDALVGFDLSNVTHLNYNSLTRSAHHHTQQREFDLVCAFTQVDQLRNDELPGFFNRLNGLLKPSGTAIFSSILPGRIGSGWAAVCLNWVPHTHEERALSGHAAAAGFSAYHYLDAGDYITWSVLQRTRQSSQAGNSYNGN